MSSGIDNSTVDKIAIIGMAGRFPGANSIDALWENLCRGRESITYFAEDEIDPEVSTELLKDSNYIRARGIIEDADKFDADFFGMTPREAELMDPQNRILLEVAWEALENAGYDPSHDDGLVGVFAGAGFNSYLVNNVLTRPDLVEILGRHQVEIANAPDYLATRVSYKLNLRGPSVSLYTGCSSSLVAVCYGVESLLGYHCDMALAGGVFVATPLKSGYLYKEGEMLSPDGHTRPFDADAGGTVFSSGCGMVLLKRLEDAIDEGDHIYALIRGVALNNDGSNKVSFTAPSVDGQAQVVAMAQANADVTPDMVSYIETHGTATMVGDPIEFEALSQVFRNRTRKGHYCPIGSIKSNIGHLDAAAGVAGLIKTSLALYNQKIPPSINFNSANPAIDFENNPFYTNTGLLDWESDGTPRIAGISSFGVGGTNAHVIMEQAPEKTDVASKGRWHLLPLSAKSAGALDSATSKLAEFLEHRQGIDLGNAAYTLQHGRTVFNRRRVAVCKDLDDAKQVLNGQVPQRLVNSTTIPTERNIVFMFSGQGSQYVGMGRDLYRHNTVFRNEMDKCSEILKPSLGLDLREIIYPADYGLKTTSESINETYLTQPALFTIEYALARLWESMGITPSAYVGHSIGEYVAACLSGVFALEDALHLVVRRGELIQSLPRGYMMAIFSSEEKVQTFLGSGVDLAAVNAKNLCVVSAESEQIEALEKRLKSNSITCRRLLTSHAFHSSMMDPIKNQLLDAFSKVKRHKPSTPYLSNVTGTWIQPDEATDPNYWWSHTRQTVQFGKCINKLIEDENRLFIELGPGNTLCSLVAQQTDNQVLLASLRHVKEKIDDEAFLLKSFGKLWASGVSIDWSRLAEDNHHRIPLPLYPFEKKRHWVTPKMHHSDRLSLADKDHKDTHHGLVTKDGPESKGADTQIIPEGSEVEAKITGIWKKILGYRSIGLDDNYFELGGNSLMAVRLFEQIEKITGKRVPLATLYDAPTIRSLAALISKVDYKPNWASLVKIQTGKKEIPPLFCMHAEGGNVLEYHSLSKHLGNDQPIYGLQAIGLDATEIVAPTIEEMAEHFINEIKTVQPKGPYFIGGYCLGGLVAFEMAQQLQASGEEVAFLALISTTTPGQLRNKKPGMSLAQEIYHWIMGRVLLELNNLSAMRWRKKLIYVKERFLRANMITMVKFEKMIAYICKKMSITFKWHSRSYILQRSVELSDDSYMSYKPQPINNTLFLYRVSERKKTLADDPLLGWGGLAKNGVQDSEIYGFHKNILLEPNVRGLAKKLKFHLEQHNKSKTTKSN